MKALKPRLSLRPVVARESLAECLTTSTQTANILDGIRISLDKAGLNDVSAIQDLDQSVVTLGGHVLADRDKARAECIARYATGGPLVANQIAVIPLDSGRNTGK